MKIHGSFKKSALPNLMQAISLLKNEDEAMQFFTDLCTPAELESMADRWQVVPLLRQGIPYRTIHEETGVSVTTITRVARCLSFGTGGYRLIAERLEKL
ncbi:TPA: YerC/YecD family TrpR-related protein [Legionella pneumophila]|uniref:Transposase n=4 Tax=Legionella pneumophila TaxID=446 RepID=A0A3A6UNP0_LEGPN|nr:YerC/YecD family TrpR-related protein [Legionella pneumophila]ERH42243.1 Trp repressor [Legionella pneumophila str. Leg01/11]ERH46841.1 Trp repressor [Legionella pneumophila str. Leg01/53]ERI48304.1 Trp repressor [Legionella pneumophila str. Leg01/20]AMQ27545.1 transposase [Legionella pneumophila subsp. pneumophila]AMV13982.1 Trp operon repressor [Legionella pneumophila]